MVDKKQAFVGVGLLGALAFLATRTSANLLRSQQKLKVARILKPITTIQKPMLMMVHVNSL